MDTIARAPRSKIGKRCLHAPSIFLHQLRRWESAVFSGLLIVTFLAYFYASDLKGIWNDDAVRLIIANGGIPTESVETRHPNGTDAVLAAIGPYAPQPLYLLLVNRILRITKSYSVIPIVTTNLLIFLLSAIGIHQLSRRLLPPAFRFMAVILYLWNGFAMVHVLQVREYPLILCFLVFNTLLFYQLLCERSKPKAAFWLLLATYGLTCVGAFFTTKWAPFFLWPQAVIAGLALAHNRIRGGAILGSLLTAALVCLPSVLATPRNSAVFMTWDKAQSTVKLLLQRLYQGTEHLLIGRHMAGFGVLTIYNWAATAILVIGLIIFCCRFFRERREIQHLVLTVIGFLSFQIAFFFWRDPLSSWPRYFILYLPYVAVLIPLVIFRIFRATKVATAARTYFTLIALLTIASSGIAQIRSNYHDPYVDHGPDFREVYRYLITRVNLRDEIVVGISTNRMALAYYWPRPNQIRFRYAITASERARTCQSFWTVSYKDEHSSSYEDYAAQLKKFDYRLAKTETISGVTIRQFRAQQEQAPD